MSERLVRIVEWKTMADLGMQMLEKQYVAKAREETLGFLRIFNSI